MTQNQPAPAPPAFVLGRGPHRDAGCGTCLLEAASVLGGFAFSDHPPGVSPLIRNVVTVVNDHLGQGRRQGLVPLIPAVLGTDGSDALDEARRGMLVRWWTKAFFLPQLDLTPDFAALARTVRGKQVNTPADVAALAPAINETGDWARGGQLSPDDLPWDSQDTEGDWSALHLAVGDAMREVLGGGLWASDWARAAAPLYDAATLIMRECQVRAVDRAQGEAGQRALTDVTAALADTLYASLYRVLGEVCALRDPVRPA